MSDFKSDALSTIGTVLSEPMGRDAIHVAVLSAVAKYRMKPGWRVGVKDGVASIDEPTIGIVDPFLNGDVLAGDHFWVCLYPRTITSLRHVWTLPGLEEAGTEAPAQPRPRTAVDLSTEWIADYAARLYVPADELLERAGCYLESGEYWNKGDRFDGVYLDDEFWTHYEVVTGRSVPDKDRGSFFLCSC